MTETDWLLGATTFGNLSRKGYGNYGASRRKIGLEEWRADTGTPDEDIIANLPLLRARSRDLFMGAPVAAAAILTLRTNVVGSGIVPMPSIDGEALGKTKEECAKINKFIDDEFAIFAKTVECDHDRRSTFYELQDLVFTNQCISGDVLVLLPIKKRANGENIYETRIRLIEADRVASPFTIGRNATGSDETDSGARKIFGGVELSDDGEVVAYWVCKQHPLGSFAPKEGFKPEDFQRVPAFGEATGRPMAFLVGEMERPEQRRAVPLMSKCLTELKNLQRYIESTTVRAVIQSYFTAFVTSTMPSTEMFDGITEGAEDARADLVTRDPYIVKLGPGIINWMRPGDSIQFPINASPDEEFEQYVTALCKFIGSALGIPYEVLLKNFTSSYSASRASLLQFWGRVKVMRQQLIDSFLQPTYTAWMMEAVAKGIIDAPGFFENPRIRRAWTRCLWAGASQGSIDPLKEIQASKVRVEMGVSTIERESQELNGSDWRANTIQQGLEKALADENDLPYTRAAKPASPFGGGGSSGPEPEQEPEEENQ